MIPNWKLCHFFFQDNYFVLSTMKAIIRQMHCYHSIVVDWTDSHLSMQSSYFSVARKPMIVYVTVAA